MRIFPNEAEAFYAAGVATVHWRMAGYRDLTFRVSSHKSGFKLLITPGGDVRPYYIAAGAGAELARGYSPTEKGEVTSMVRILVATTPAQMRDEIVKYLEWRRAMFGRHADRFDDLNARAKWRTVELMFGHVATDIREAFIVTTITATENTRERSTLDEVRGQTEGTGDEISKFTLRMPMFLYQKIARLAKSHGVSTQKYIETQLGLAAESTGEPGAPPPESTGEPGAG